MPNCDFCDEEIGYLPFKCKYCGGTFCKNHRLPENHDCSFSLRHQPVVPQSPREKRPLYGGARVAKEQRRASEFEDPKKLKKYLKKQRKERRRYKSPYSRDRGGGGLSSRLGPRPKLNRPETSTTTWLIGLILICSIISIILSLFGLDYLIKFSMFGVASLYLWTFATSLFVSSSGGLFGIFFLMILVYIFIYLAGNFEYMFGSKFLWQLYLFCAFCTALLYILLRVIMIPLYPLSPLNVIPIGLASGAIIGLIAFIIFPNQERRMTLLIFFIPVKMKGKSLLILIALFSIVPGLIYAIFFGPIYLALYLPDLGGIIGAYIMYSRKTRNSFY